MKEKLRNFFGNKKVAGGLSLAWILLIWPYYIVVGTISGLGIVYGILHDYLCTLFGHRDKAYVGEIFTDVLNATDIAWDELDEKENLFD